MSLGLETPAQENQVEESLELIGELETSEHLAFFLNSNFVCNLTMFPATYLPTLNYMFVVLRYTSLTLDQ